MDNVVSETGGDFRSVTQDEISHYQKFGWVKLNKFVPMDRVNAILALAKERMGENGDRDAPPEAFSYFNSLVMNGLNNPVLGPVIWHCARNARALMARAAQIGVRYFSDYYNVKLPSIMKGHGGNGITGWHQDYAAAGSDRSGATIFWIALDDLPPEKGTMAFLNGSHRYGVLGHFSTYGNGNVLDSYPELLADCTPTGLLPYAAGDVTVHSNMCVHSAGLNVTDGPRWTYTVMISPADACWNGGAVDAFDTTGLKVHGEFDDGRFPILA